MVSLKYSFFVYRISTDPWARADRVYHTACQVSQMVYKSPTFVSCACNFSTFIRVFVLSM